MSNKSFSNPLMNYLGVEDANRNLLRITYFAFFTSGMVSTILGAILPDIREAYNISYVVSGTAYSCHQIGNMLAAIIAGFLPFAIGRKKSTLSLFCVLVIGLILISLQINPAVLLLAFIFTGIGRGTLSNITNVVVAETTTNKTAGLNILHAIFAFGALLSPTLLIVFSFFIPNIGWKLTLWFIAICMIIAILLIKSSTLSNTPSKKIKKNTVETESPFYKSVSFWLSVAILTFYQCSEAGNVGWLVTYFKDAGIMSPSFARIMASLLWIMVMCGRFFTAAISSKLNKNKLLVLLALANTLFFVLMISTRSMPIVIAGLLGTGFSMAGIYPTIFASLKPEYNSSTVAVGTIMGVGLVGAISMPIIIGAVAQNTTNMAMAAGLTTAQAENRGVTSGISLIAVALVIMLILTIVKYFESKAEEKKNNA